MRSCMGGGGAMMGMRMGREIIVGGENVASESR